MDKWNLVIDVALCQNCNNCVLVAKDELVGNEFPGYSAPHPAQGAGVFRIERQVRGSGHMVDSAHMPVMCNHCDNAPCVAAGGGAVRRRADGIVLIDPELAKGRRDLVESCPYGAIVWNEAENLPQSWFFDAHLLDAGWDAPRCVSVCPTRAITATKVSDATMAERAQSDGLRALRPELGTRPRVYYKNLHRFDRLFVAGSVVARADGRIECVEGARVQLMQEAREIQSTTTDAFGDFKLDGLEREIGPVRVMVSHTRYGRCARDAAVGAESVVLGELVLEGA
jgi:Fe-S-cluster-containing dehydrogenase component